jgi:hypothetical protein
MKRLIDGEVGEPGKSAASDVPARLREREAERGCTLFQVTR